MAAALTVDWEQVADEWRVRKNDTLRGALLLYLSPADLDLLEEMLRISASGAVNEDEARRRMGHLFTVVAEQPHGALLLTLYTYSLCLETWELSTGYARITVVLDALAEEAPVVSGSEAGDALLRAAVALAEAQEPSMATENAFNCSCPVTAQQEGAAVLDRVRPVLDVLGRREPGDPELRPVADLLTQDARVLAAYFDCVQRAAAVVEAWIGGADDIDERLSQAEEAIRYAEQGVLRNDVYGTEARSHRLALEALHRQLGRRRIHVEDATVTYCYPFSLPRMSPGLAVELAGSLGGRSFGGVQVEQVDDLKLTDVWRSNDERGRSHGGVRLVLAPLRVTTLAGQVVQYDVEMRISRLGNHYLRMETRLLDADIHVVNQTLRRASMLMGEEHIDSAGLRWTKCGDYADRVIRECAVALTALADGRGSDEGPTAQYGAQLVVDVERFFTVLLSARSIVLVAPDGGRVRATGSDLPDATGYSLLSSPLRPAAVALEEWVMYDFKEPENLFAGIGFCEDLGIRTSNTTVLYMPNAPSWVHLGYEEMAEFVAALPPLFAGLESRLVDLSERLDKEVPDLRQRLHQLPGPDLTPLYERQFEVHHLEAESERLVALLKSPRLCQSSSHRQFLDAVMDRAVVRGMESDLHRQLAVLSHQHDRLTRVVDAVVSSRRREEQHSREERERQDALDRQREEEARRVQQGRLNVLLAFVGVTALAELFGWLDNSFGVRTRWGWAPWAELAVIGLGIVLIVVLSRASWQRSHPGKAEHASDRPA
ncbi:hypothetical protein [Geodermatophilus sabuli]|uniref:hypothetical protein n=1 Tax=Geodermatophilus sabuli TaxID=1564158 RepID=UPI000BE43553|nr:hypothetical protein [Geodermatophilus sabuli]MBB3087007.1 hypothetical protein [Geodermatophilus sabuli]